MSPGSATSCRIVSEVISLIFHEIFTVVFPREPAKVPAEAVMGKEMMQMLIMWLKSSCFDSPILRQNKEGWEVNGLFLTLVIKCF